MFMGNLLGLRLEPLVRDTFLIPTQLLGRSAEQGASAPIRRRRFGSDGVSRCVLSGRIGEDGIPA